MTPVETSIPKKKKFLTISDVSAAKDEEYAEIDVWGSTFLAGSLTADDFIEWQEQKGTPAERNAGLILIMKSMCGELDACPACNGEDVPHKGVHPRTGNEKHIATYKDKSVASTEKVIRAIAKLNDLRSSASPKNV